MRWTTDNGITGGRQDQIEIRDTHRTEDMAGEEVDVVDDSPWVKLGTQLSTVPIDREHESLKGD